MTYALYRVFEDKAYYWGKWDNPIELANACFNIGKEQLSDGILITQHADEQDIVQVIDL